MSNGISLGSRTEGLATCHFLFDRFGNSYKEATDTQDPSHYEKDLLLPFSNFRSGPDCDFGCSRRPGFCAVLSMELGRGKQLERRCQLARQWHGVSDWPSRRRGHYISGAIRAVELQRAQCERGELDLQQREQPSGRWNGGLKYAGGDGNVEQGWHWLADNSQWRLGISGAFRR